MKKNSNRTLIFLKQDIFKLSTFAFIILSLISGGSIIYSREFLGGPFRIDNIYALYSTISEFLLMFVAVNLFGKEFHYKTINMIRISKRSNFEIIARKLLNMMVLCVLVAICSFLEVKIYAVLFHHKINTFDIAQNLLVGYCIYGMFLFSLSTVIVLLSKNTLLSFIIVLAIVSFSPMIMNLLAENSITKFWIKFIPFSFMRNAFYFANYNLLQIITMCIWSFVLLIISCRLFSERGYV